MSKATKPKGKRARTKPALVQSIPQAEQPRSTQSSPQQQATPETPVPVPLGTVRAMSEFINAATGPCQLAMQIMQSLQLAVDRAGLGRQAMQQPNQPPPE
jgi:hypothetical protein